MKKNLWLARLNNWFVFILFSVVVGAITFASVLLVNYLRKEEIRRINLFATAIKYQQETKSPTPEVLDLILQINETNSNIPVVVTDRYRQPIGPDFQKNIPPAIASDPKKMRSLLLKMESVYPPIELRFPDGNNQFVFYDNSKLLNNLRYTPYLIGLLVFLYLAFSFWFLRTIKKTDEGFLWAGLAKETAHQIGTPLSSMIGWIEILKMENPDSEGLKEFEKDISRLKTISERFSKIGSVPELNELNINETLQINYDYLRTRISSRVSFTLQLPNHPVLVPHNRILTSWVVENLVKNAVDAMKGEGKIVIRLYEKSANVCIEISDTGSGMTQKIARNVFKPGFSTKKRGWGLGLSLAKRVISEYHNGDIRVSQTEPGKGTTFRITVKNS